MHPANPNEVWFPQVPMLKTIDGGKTIEYVKGIAHGDNHDLWIDPDRSEADDRRPTTAACNISRNGGANWYAPPLPISQFYHVSVDNRRPYWVAGAMQDLGTAQGPSDSLAGGIHLTDWHDVGGGEAGHVYSDPSDPNIVYAGEYLGIITRYDHRTKESRNVSAWPENPSGKGGEEMKYRFQWTAPISGSPFDPKVVYHGAQVIFRTRDGGQTWDGDQPRPHAQRQGEAEVDRRPDHRRQHGRRDLRHRVRDRRVAEAEGPDLGGQRRRSRARHDR